MDAGTHSIKKIFGQDRRLIVPLFQRPYVWRRELQWEPLWEDVRAVADRIARKQATRPHFLGAIVLDQVPNPIGTIETRVVIDGQQRLTTIQLLLEAFSDIAAELGQEKFRKALLKLTRNDDPMSDEPTDVYKVWPTNVDQAHFRRVMDVRNPYELKQLYNVPESKSVTGHALADGYLFFHGQILEWIAPNATGLEDRLLALFNTLQEYVRMVVIDLSEDDDAQLIFETLNARGTPLLPSDLVKNFLFHRARTEGASIEKLYKTYWKPFDEDSSWWRKEIGRGHAKRARVDTFIQHFLTAKKRDNVPVAQLYSAFREYADGTVSAEEHLVALRTYAELFRRFDKFASTAREGAFFARLAMMDISTAYPFLLDLFNRHGADSARIHTILVDLESFLIRRMVCQLSTRGYNRLFVELLGALDVQGEDPARSVREFLLKSQAGDARWPNDDELLAAWLSTPIFAVQTQARVRMLLEALEAGLRSRFAETIEIKTKLTIEHILPQHWRGPSWPLPEGSDPHETGAMRDRALHTLGNLTLLTSGLNPSISNGPWAKKVVGLKKSLLALNKELEGYPAWGEEQIEQRGRALFEVARAIWPHPGRIGAQQ